MYFYSLIMSEFVEMNTTLSSDTTSGITTSLPDTTSGITTSQDTTALEVVDLSNNIYKYFIEPIDKIIGYYDTCNCENLENCETCKYNNAVSNYSYEEHYKYVDAIHDIEQNEYIASLQLTEYDAETLAFMKELEDRERELEEADRLEFNSHGYGSNYNGGYDSY